MLKPIKSVDVTVAFCDEGWGQMSATISVPVGGDSESIVKVLEASVAPLYASAKLQRETAARAEEAKDAKVEVPF